MDAPAGAAAEVRALADAGDGPGALALVARVWREAWFTAGDIEGAGELGNASAAATERHSRGWVELHRGKLEAAADRFHEFEQAANAAHHRPWLALNRAGLAAARGDVDEARARLAAGEALISE